MAWIYFWNLKKSHVTGRSYLRISISKRWQNSFATSSKPWPDKKNIFKGTVDTGVDCFNQIKNLKNHATSFTSHPHSSHRWNSRWEICSFPLELHVIKTPLEVSQAINFNPSFSFNFHFTSTLAYIHTYMHQRPSMLSSKSAREKSFKTWVDFDQTCVR